MKCNVFILFGLISSLAFASPNDITIVAGGQSHVVTEREMLGMTQRSIVSSTSWTGANNYTWTGPLLSDVLGDLPPKGVIDVEAYNDYVATIPLEYIKSYAPILAHSRNGKRLTITEKGPWMIMFPRNDYPALRRSDTDAYYVWHIKKITIIPTK